jgi:hypothetical protein
MRVELDLTVRNGGHRGGERLEAGDIAGGLG